MPTDIDIALIQALLSVITVVAILMLIVLNELLWNSQLNRSRLERLDAEQAERDRERQAFEANIAHAEQLQAEGRRKAERN